MTLARAGKLAGATIINNLGLASALLPLVPYVVLRICRTDHDAPTATNNTEDAGRACFVDPFFWSVYAGADSRLILQYGNEENQQHDGSFYVGLMKAADEHGRKVVIFNDSVGATTDDMWHGRREALVFAKAHGHFVGLHAYGEIDGTYHPATAWDDPGMWQWFAGRFEHLYNLMPAEAQPDLLLTEWGAGGYQQDAGLDNWLRDVRTMQAWSVKWPYLKGWFAWTVGGAGLYGFGRDTLDGWLAAL